MAAIESNLEKKDWNPLEIPTSLQKMSVYSPCSVERYAGTYAQISRTTRGALNVTLKAVKI